MDNEAAAQQVPARSRYISLKNPVNQAARVFAKFGGVPGLYRAMQALGAPHARNISAFYRWLMPKAKGGTGGMIPSSAMQSVHLAARREGILLTPDDLWPGRSA